MADLKLILDIGRRADKGGHYKVWAHPEEIAEMVKRGGEVLRSYQDMGGIYLVEVRYEGILFITGTFDPPPFVS